MSITSEEYVSLVTYTKDGRPKPLPVWIVDLDNNTGGFTTHGDSWKVKRIKNNPNVTLQACDQRGNVTDGAPVVEATARVGTEHEYAQVAALVKDKYGFWVTLIKAMNSVRSMLGKGGQSDTAIIFELS